MDRKQIKKKERKEHRRWTKSKINRKKKDKQKKDRKQNIKDERKKDTRQRRESKIKYGMQEIPELKGPVSKEDSWVRVSPRPRFPNGSEGWGEGADT